MHEDDRSRLLHMRDAAEEVASFIGGKDRSVLAEDRMLALALVRLIEVIGEAASAISLTLREDHPEVPWAQMVAMRNRLIHGYFQIDYDRVWDTVTANIPQLLAVLKPIVEEHE